MNEHELSALVGAFVLDSLDQLERALFETHLAGCVDCAAETTSLRAAAAELSHTSSLKPPPGVRSELLSMTSRLRPLPPRAVQTALRPWPARRQLWPALAAACAVIAVATASWGLEEHQRLSGHRLSPVALSSVLDSADVATAFATVGNSGHASLIYSRTRQRLVLIGQDIPAPPDGKTYQLWLFSPDNTATSAGSFQPNRDGSVVMQTRCDLNRTGWLAISIEQGAGAAQPTPGAIIATIVL